MNLKNNSYSLKPSIGNIFVSLIALLIGGCVSQNHINDSKVQDRVKACSAGFSDDVNVALQLAYNKTTLQGGSTVDFKNESQAVIFSMLPPQDRLKAYEDYVACIENNWNKNNLSMKKKHISINKKNQNKL